MVRRIRLDQHVGKVDIDQYLARANDCQCIIWLTDRERYVVLSHLLPFAEWETRLVRPVDRELWETASDPEWEEYTDFLNDLVIKLTGGDTTMGCNAQIYNGLLAVAEALRTAGGNGGGCASSGPAAVLNCIGSMTEDELVPQPAEPDQQYGTPPAGFDTWAEYLTYKCQAAYAVFDAVHNLFGALAILPIAQATVTVIGTVLGGYIAATAFGAVAFPPAGILAIAAAAVVIGALDGLAYAQARTIQDYLIDHKAEIICALYTSGSAADAINAIGDFLEDAIQAVEWSTLFGPTVGPELAAAFGTIASQAVTNNLVNPLFRLTVDLAYPGADCDACGSQPGATIEWHFTTQSPEGWEGHSHFAGSDYAETEYLDQAVTPDPNDPEEPNVWDLISGLSTGTPASGTCITHWLYTFTEPNQPVMLTGDQLKADFYVTGNDHVGIVARVYYTDSTHDEEYIPNPAAAGWQTVTCDTTPGKTVSVLELEMHIGLIDNYQIAGYWDFVRLGQ